MKKLFTFLLSALLFINVFPSPTAHAIRFVYNGDRFLNQEVTRIEDSSFLYFEHSELPDCDYTYYYIPTALGEDWLNGMSPVLWHTDQLYFLLRFEARGYDLSSEEFDELSAHTDRTVKAIFGESYQVECETSYSPDYYGVSFYTIKGYYDPSLTYHEILQQPELIEPHVEKAEQLFRELSLTNYLESFGVYRVSTEAAIVGSQSTVGADLDDSGEHYIEASWARYSTNTCSENGEISFEEMQSTLQNFVDDYAPTWQVKGNDTDVICLYPNSGQEVYMEEWMALCQQVYDVTGYRVQMMPFYYLDRGTLTGINVHLSGGYVSLLNPNGDATLDGVTDSADALTALQEYIQVSVLEQDAAFTATQRVCADVDGDGVISAEDALAILSLYVSSMG